MTLEDKVHITRLHVLQRAKDLGNVSAACREAGISRSLYYRWRKRFELYGRDGLHPRRTAKRPGCRSTSWTRRRSAGSSRWRCRGLPGDRSV